MIKNKIYNLLAFAVVMALIVLLLCMGIIAVQKSMKLNLSFAANPTVYCEILVNGEPVFNNKTSTIASGVSLSANVLTFNSAVSSAATYGQNFTLQIKNYVDTESAIHIEFKNATITTTSVDSSGDYAEIVASDNYSNVLNISTSGAMQIVMTKVVPVALSFGSNVSIDLENSNVLSTTNSGYGVPLGEDLKVKVIVNSGYNSPYYTLNNGSQISLPADR